MDERRRKGNFLTATRFHWELISWSGFDVALFVKYSPPSKLPVEANCHYFIRFTTLSIYLIRAVLLIAGWCCKATTIDSFCVTCKSLLLRLLVFLWDKNHDGTFRASMARLQAASLAILLPKWQKWNSSSFASTSFCSVSPPKSTNLHSNQKLKLW